MKISKIKFYINLENISMNTEFSSNQCNLYLLVDNILYPDINYTGLPITILRWMLKELRLLVSKSNKKRKIYLLLSGN
jgi:hypothetical protein